jgi:hypothetical protein
MPTYQDNEAVNDRMPKECLIRKGYAPESVGSAKNVEQFSFVRAMDGCHLTP